MIEKKRKKNLKSSNAIVGRTYKGATCLMMVSCPQYPIDKDDNKEAEEKAIKLYELTKPYKAELLNYKTGYRKYWNGTMEIVSQIRQIKKVNIDILKEVLRIMKVEKKKIYHYCVIKLLRQGDLGTGYEDLTPDSYIKMMSDIFGTMGRSQLYNMMPKGNTIDEWTFDYKNNAMSKANKLKDFARKLVQDYEELLDTNKTKS